MPKITINERDNSSAGRNPYNNFSVLIPGYIASGKEDAFIDAADENGVLEIKGLDEEKFKKTVGYVAIDANTVQSATAPVYADPQNLTEAEFDKYFRNLVDTTKKYEAKELSEDKVIQFGYSKVYLAAGEANSISFAYITLPGYEYSNFSINYYTTDEENPVELTDPADQIAVFENGKLVGKKIGETKISLSYTYDNETVTDDCIVVVEEAPTAGTFCVATPVTDGKISELSSKEFTFSPVEIEDSWVGGRLYTVVTQKGVAGDPKSQYGNQIANELIKLGYTVLYKGMYLNAFTKGTETIAATSVSGLADSSFYAGLDDKSIYDFRYIINGLLDNTSNVKTGADQCISSLASKRGDCIALLDVAEETYVSKTQSDALSSMVADINSHNSADAYSAFFAPAVTLNIIPEDEYGANKHFPASFYYLACAAKAATNYNEWYAVAGYTRGICNYSIESVGCKFGEIAVDALEPRDSTSGLGHAVNLIIKVKNNYYLWGNRTATLLTSDGLKFSHFLNVRQLCTTIKKQVYVACRQFTFDPNSDILWANFCAAIRPTLETMKGDQGITAYKFIKVPTTQKGILTAKIRIVPIEAVEDFEITLMLEDNFGETTVTVSETN